MSIVEISPVSIIPVVSPEIFKGHEDSSFWLGRVATGNDISRPDYYDALMKFRGNVYVTELEFLSEDHLDEKGREIDEYDQYSIEFMAVENVKEEDDLARVVASGRLITKENPDTPLPIEHFFPEVFDGKPLPDNAVEVSRFIARHKEDSTQHALALSIIRAMTHYSVDTQVEADYCIIEKPLIKLLGSIGLPMDVLGEPKNIPEYGGTLYPIRINPYKIIDSVTKDKTGNILLKRFFSREAENKGEGFYPTSLTGGTNG